MVQQPPIVIVPPNQDVADALQKLVDLAEKYGAGPNQEVRNAVEWGRMVLANARKSAADK